MRLRARAVPVGHTIQIREQDPASITVHGLRTYPQDIPRATADDVEAVEDVILAADAIRLPQSSMRLPARDVPVDHPIPNNAHDPPPLNLHHLPPTQTYQQHTHTRKQSRI